MSGRHFLKNRMWSVFSPQEGRGGFNVSFSHQALRLEAVDLSAFSSAAELESLGLERLKCELMALGLKCGGTLQERAARLFSVRGLAKEHIDPALFAKPSKGKKK